MKHGVTIRAYCFHLLLLLAFAAHPGHAAGLTANFDARNGGKLTPTEEPAAAAALRAELPGVALEFGSGTVHSVSRPDGFLTGPRAARAGAPTVEHAATRAFLDSHRGLFGHGAELLDTARVARDSTGTHNGLRSVVWVQRQRGLEVFGARLASHTMADGRLLRITGSFLGGVTNSTADPTPVLSAPEAAARAAQELAETVTAAEIQVTTPAEAADPTQKQTLRTPSFKGDAWARLLWLPVDNSTLRLCWEVEWMSRARGEMFRTLVDATDGKVWVRHGLTANLSDATFNVYTSDSPTPKSPGWPTSSFTTQPATTNRVLVTLSALDTNASPAGWINDGGNETIGNNVDAHLDRNNDDIADTPRPQGSPARVFDFPLDLAQDPTNYADASVVQLFYLNNWIHDKFYGLGFTEAAGNFQTDNFGRGGLGNDAVQADGQDGGGTDNANFSTPSDGSTPRMQMYLFSFPSPRRDGSLDAEVVTHEYTHGLSTRLVGGGSGITSFQTSGMGEGWSDFYALCLLSDPADDPDAIYASGAYVSYQLGSASFLNNYYFGIRAYPYTTDMTKNPMTFGDIDSSIASLHPGIPRNTFSASTTADEVHSMGTVWCAMLWEMRANLVHKLGSTVGNQLALQLVTDGMKLSPANPTFTQARDAILAAELADTGGTNRAEVWAGFAKRGMGLGAADISGYIAVVESYDVPDDLRIRPFARFDTSGPLGGAFTNAAVYTLTNTGTNTLTWTVSTPTNWLTISPTNGTLAAGATVTVTATPNTAANALGKGIYTANFWFTNLSDAVAFPRVYRLGVGNPDYYAERFDGVTRSNDLSFSQFTFTPLGTTNYTVCREAAATLPVDPTGANFVALSDDSTTNVTLTGTNTVALYGARTNVVSIGSNGYLTWGGDTSYEGGFPAHFALRRISLFYRDLNPNSGASGKISWRQLSDRLVVTYQGVPQYGSTTLTNTGQAELFYSGHIRLTFLSVKTTDNVVGLSAGGGVPADFVPSDLSQLGLCQLAPVVTLQPTNRVVGISNSVYFNALAGLGASPLTYRWKKDGVNYGTATNVNLTNTQVQFSDAGSYTLVITNLYGSITSVVASLTVTSPPPTVAFTATPTNAYVSVPVAFSNTTSLATNYTWSFGDGTNASGTNVTHAYVAPGTYTVKLTALGNGGSNSLTRTNYIVASTLPLLVTPVFTNAGFRFTFPTLAGHNYTVQYKDSLADTNWLALAPTNFAGTGGNLTFTNTPPGTQRYYRLLTQ